METMSESQMTNTDRFSNLPDDVAHKVISSLEMEDISRLSIVSKRCRKLCLSTPFLSFDVIPYRTNARKRARLMNYLERLLLLRKEKGTQYFRIRWCLQSSSDFAEEEYRILSWLYYALTCNSKLLVLDVNLKSGSDFVLPPILFNCKSLESLVLRFGNGAGILKIPPSSGGTSGFSSLKYLKMRSIQVDEHFGELISSYCKSLEELSLLGLRGIKSITITSSSLKVLYVSFAYDLLHLHISAEKLAHVCLFWAFNSPNNCEVQLSAPKLENVAYVVEHSTEPKPSFDKNLVRVLRAVAGNIKCLMLTNDSMRGLLQLGYLTTQFTNLEVLQIWITGSSDDLLPILVSFSKRTPNLQALYIKKCLLHNNANGVGDNRALGLRESQDVLSLQNLKIVGIQLVSKGGMN